MTTVDLWPICQTCSITYLIHSFCDRTNDSVETETSHPARSLLDGCGPICEYFIPKCKEEYKYLLTTRPPTTSLKTLQCITAY